jgi:hypothetical protein
LFWTWLWGPIGLILSTPLTLCLVVVGRHAKALEFFDVLLGDRPALPVVERFYQRVLAGDPDEIMAQAEAYVAARSLLEYYDCVAVPGLTLAARDEARESIDAARVSTIRRSMTSIVADLGRAAGSGAQPSRGIVACVEGRGCFDEVVASMLQQLVEREGFATRRIEHHAVSRDEIGGLDLKGVTTIVLTHLELSGTPPHLRYLVTRVRQQAPDATLIVGLWPAGNAAPTGDDAGGPIGANRYTTSLAETIAAVRASTAS